uniref:Secreted protein n=1 Tax=Angiostrongylus cantonensis TaxID=6313 RepID=A0A0K0D007_ANGCA
MTVVVLLILLLTLVRARNNEILSVYKSCRASEKTVPTSGNSTFPSSSQLPEWCLTMRHDVAPCIAEKLLVEDDGSISSRGNVLLHAYEQSEDDEIKKDVKLYHYGCLYNSWHNFIDENCYK